MSDGGLSAPLMKFQADIRSRRDIEAVRKPFVEAAV